MTTATHAPPEPNLEHLCRVLNAYRYNFQDETSLQEGLALALTHQGIEFKREVRLDAKNRPDFMIGTVAVEVKIKGTLSEFLRQADRYLALDPVSSLIVVGTPKWLPMVPPALRDKPIFRVRLLSSLL